MQDAASPASDADSTKRHSPAGLSVPVDLPQRQPATAMNRQPGSGGAAAGRAGQAAQRKRKSNAGAQQPAAADRLVLPGGGDVPASNAAERPDPADALDLAPVPQHPAEQGRKDGGAAAKLTEALQLHQQVQPHRLQDPDSPEPVMAAEPRKGLGGAKQLGDNAAVSPLQNGRKARLQPSSGRGDIGSVADKVSGKHGPPASSQRGELGADVPAAPSQQHKPDAEPPATAVDRQPQGHTMPGQADQLVAGITQQVAAEAAGPSGNGAAAPLPVGLHYLSSSGSTLRPLGELT
jgi:hypothetical protein